MVIPIPDALIYYVFLLLFTGGAWYFANSGNWIGRANHNVFLALCVVVLVIWSFCFALGTIFIIAALLQS